MTHQRTLSFLAFLPALGGCVGGAADDASQECNGGKCDLAEDSCELDGRYGDGTCDLSCGQPDTDCFLFLESHEDASSWFDDFEAPRASSESRPPRGVVPASDPRYQVMQPLLEEAWASYRQVHPVGELAQSPALIIIEDGSVNAFVARDPFSESKVAWAVIVHSGMLDADIPDAEILGVMMHELTHAVKLHVLPGVKDQVNIHYQVSPGAPEPIGSRQADDPFAREAITGWIELGRQAGSSPLPELNGMPLSYSEQPLFAMVLNAAIARGAGANPEACAGVSDIKAQIDQLLLPNVTSLDVGLLHVDSAQERTALSALTTELRDELANSCLADLDLEFVTLVTELFDIDLEQVQTVLTDEDLSLIEGQPFVEQVTSLVEDRHDRMLELASLVEEETGYGMESMRYFSSEEQADDYSAPVLLEMGLPADGQGTFLIRILPAPDQERCHEYLDSGDVPPYGDLVDAHHGPCWRVHHLQALEAELTGVTPAYSMRAPRRADPEALEALRSLRVSELSSLMPARETSEQFHRAR